MENEQYRADEGQKRAVKGRTFCGQPGPDAENCCAGDLSALDLGVVEAATVVDEMLRGHVRDKKLHVLRLTTKNTKRTSKIASRQREGNSLSSCIAVSKALVFFTVQYARLGRLRRGLPEQQPQCTRCADQSVLFSISFSIRQVSDGRAQNLHGDAAGARYLAVAVQALAFRARGAQGLAEKCGSMRAGRVAKIHAERGLQEAATCLRFGAGWEEEAAEEEEEEEEEEPILGRRHPLVRFREERQVMNDLRVTTASEGFRIPQRGILQDFRPEVLPSTASFAMVLLFLEVGVAKMGFYVVGSAVPFLELMANCSYKFVPVTMMVLARIVTGQNPIYWVFFAYFAATAAWAIRRFLLHFEPSGTREQYGVAPSAMHGHMILGLALVQLPLCWFLTPSAAAPAAAAAAPPR
ncbi:hypothetical protein AK812_SmicGene27172 [Symbiodinium microadriaticum]|uniref:Uncharacterized protein n=1 Tax=Symbiodinium microadriaticum TaxID=2951 RepID=A0A1Q9D7J6_SYMMI|nr:hypothetical protein AK812_SmicGene27172 [Symbiodinium microadriaticum]